MNKVVLTLLIISWSGLCNSQVVIDGCCITQTAPPSSSLSWSNDTIAFAFGPDEYFWDLTITNRTTENISCIWDEALFIVNDLSSKVIFDNTTIMLKNDPLPPSKIAPGTKIKKSIFPLENFGSYATNPVFTKKMIKRSGEKTVTLIIPVQVGTQRSEYKFQFTVNLCDD